MSGARLIIGDSLTVLRTLPPASVDLVFTSPAFLSLRSYLPSDHPDKHLEMGSEGTPGAFIDALLGVVEECRRVLAPHGTLAIELGDTYSGSGGAGGDYGPDGLRDGQPKFRQMGSREHRPEGTAHRSTNDFAPQTEPLNGGPGWPEAKSLCLIPELFRVALVYGFNPLTGRTTPKWRARNVIRWCRPNPPVGALGDKVRPATSDIVVACVSRNRWFDLDAVRTPSDYDRPNLVGKGSRPGGTPPGQSKNCSDHTTNPAGAPPLDHWWHDDTHPQDAWLIPTHPYKGQHFASFPPALAARVVESMCPRRVCRVCGEPSRRIVGPAEYVGRGEAGAVRHFDGERVAENVNAWNTVGDKVRQRVAHTLGWSDCGCPGGPGRWRNGVVLDPFAGSGTTLSVSVGHGRDALGIDLDSRNAALAAERVGMFLEVLAHDPGVVA